jgi:hypothetical protein
MQVLRSLYGDHYDIFYTLTYHAININRYIK